MFYDLEEVLSFEDRMAWVKLTPRGPRGRQGGGRRQAARGTRSALVQGGKTLNAKLIEKLVEAGVDKIPVRAESLVGRRTGRRVVDSETGEVLVEANAELTSTLLSSDHGAAQGGALQAPRRRWPPARWTPPSTRRSRKDHFKNPDEALVEIYRRLRPGDPPTVESARALFRGMFMDPRRYDLARVGRFMINKKLADQRRTST